jgi:hypothetical protein
MKIRLSLDKKEFLNGEPLGIGGIILENKQ